MIKNYFFLNRFIVEVSDYLEGSRLVEAFSQDKDNIILTFNKNDQNNYLEISTNPGLPFINLRKNFYRAKKNTLSMFGSYLPASFQSISISDTDRIIKISLTNSDIYFAVRGKFTNVTLISNDHSKATFKKYDDKYFEEFVEEVNNLRFTQELHFPAIDVMGDDNLFIEKVRKRFPFIGKEIFNEFNRRDDETKDKIILLNVLITEVLYDDIAVLTNTKTFDVHLVPGNFYKQPFDKIYEFDSVTDAFNSYLQNYYATEELKNKYKQIDRYLTRELTRLSSKLNNLRTQLEKGSREEAYKKLGNLLLINLKSLHKGMTVIEVEDIYSGSDKIKIKLDPVLTPKQNSDRYFERARNDRINLEKSKQFYSESERKYLILTNTKKRIEAGCSVKELNDIMKELKIKNTDQTTEKDDLKLKFKHYLINDKYHIFVGKDSKNNDLLTTKFAKQNDYWFHARSVSGSHVVLRIDNTKEAVPKDILKKVASLAAYHSKAKTAGLVPVSYCFKKYVVKKKGMPVGQVALLREETLLVRPEIPTGSEYIQNDLL